MGIIEAIENGVDVEDLELTVDWREEVMSVLGSYNQVSLWALTNGIGMGMGLRGWQKVRESWSCRTVFPAAVLSVSVKALGEGTELGETR